MTEDDLKRARRSTRLYISIPVIISGVDAAGSKFSESVHTLIVNRHGGKIGTTHLVAIGTEILIENLALGVAAKASAVWFSEKRSPNDLHHVGLQLCEAQNIWGIAFPPSDWGHEPEQATPAAPDNSPASEPALNVDAETHVSSLAGEEISVRLLQELQASADAHAREFQDRLKQLTQCAGWELESDLRQRVASAKAREVGALEKEIEVLKESLSAAREELAKLEAKIQQVKNTLQATTENPPPTSLQDARRQLIALTNSVVESMNRAADTGLSEYRSLLHKENQESAARLQPVVKEDSPPPGGPAPEA